MGYYDTASPTSTALARDNQKKDDLIFGIIGIFVVAWLGLILGQCIGPGFDLSEIGNKLGPALSHPFRIRFTPIALKTLGIAELCYGIFLAYRYTTQKDYHRRGQEHGSAQWGNVRSIAARYREKLPAKDRDKNPDAMPVEKKWFWKTRTSYHSNQNKILTQNFQMGLDGHKHRRNLNTLVVGGSGAGKTRFYAKPNVLQANTSFVILDPKGELLRDTGHLLEKKGYKIRILDLIDMYKSDGYNPFRYIRNDNDVLKLVTNLFKATTPPGSKSNDPFWDETAQMMLCAIFFFLKYECPEDDQNFANVVYMLSLAEASDDGNTVSAFDLIYQELEQRQNKAKLPEHIAVKYYKLYHKAAGKTLQSIHITLASHLDKFNLPDLVKLTTNDEMDITQMGEEKTALYCLIPDSDTSFNFVVSMLYTQLFQELFYSADKVHGGALPVPVHFVMDEFANVALPDDFDKDLATMRSRGVFVSIILQNIAQLKKLFKDEWESIIGNCDELLYLGGNEKETFKYISESLGKQTVDTTSNNQTHGERGSYSTGYNNTGVDLMSPDEIRRLDNSYAILLVRGEDPILDRKYDIMGHPNIGLTPDGGGKAMIYEHGKTEKETPKMRVGVGSSEAGAQNEGIEYKPGRDDPKGQRFYTEEELDEMFSEEEEQVLTGAEVGAIDPSEIATADEIGEEEDIAQYEKAASAGN